MRNVIQRTVGYNRASQHDDRRSKSNTKQVDEIVKPEKEEDHISSEEEIYETKRKGVNTSYLAKSAGKKQELLAYIVAPD